VIISDRRDCLWSMFLVRLPNLLVTTLCAAALSGLLSYPSRVEATEAPAFTFQEVEESLTCQCGCGLTVHSCNHLQCPSALPLRAEIREQMALGKSKEEILAYFGTKYGEKILSSPTTEGLNLFAWITPFLLVAIGGTFVVLTVRRWVNRRTQAPVARATTTPMASPYREVLEKELKDFDA
jgi:cytochrome c-type biogenesis protein CcmH/NrfF